MYTLSVRNSQNQTLTLTNNESNYQIVSISGFSGSTANINTTSLAGIAGGIFNSAHTNMRNIVITVSLCGNIETNRNRLYKYFPDGENVRVFYTNATVGSVYIDGYVEKVECPQWVQNEVAQISIISTFPYFQSVTATTIASATTQTFNYAGTVECGGLFRVSVLQDSSSIQINIGSGGYIKMNSPYSVENFYTAGGMLEIDSRTAQKSITWTRNGITSNYFKYLDSSSIFPTIRPGSNTFSSAAAEYYKFGIIYNNTYRGV